MGNGVWKRERESLERVWREFEEGKKRIIMK
jgi:hypothetical protein